MDYGPLDSVHGIFQARVLEWVAISFSGDLPNPGIEPGSPALQADTLQFEPPGKHVLHVLVGHQNSSYCFGVIRCLIQVIRAFPK